VRGESPQAEDSRRFQPPNLGEAVRDAVGEMCPYPAPATEKGPAKQGLSFALLHTRERVLYPFLYPSGFVTRYGRKVLEVLPPLAASKGTAGQRLLADRGLRRARRVRLSDPAANAGNRMA